MLMKSIIKLSGLWLLQQDKWPQLYLNCIKKSCMQERPNHSTNANRNTNKQYLFFEEKKEKKFNPERLFVFKALLVGPQKHQSTSQTPPTHWPSMGAI